MTASINIYASDFGKRSFDLRIKGRVSVCSEYCCRCLCVRIVALDNLYYKPRSVTEYNFLLMPVVNGSGFAPVLVFLYRY